MKIKHLLFSLLIPSLIIGCNETDNNNSVNLADAKLVGDESINTPYGVVNMEHNFISDESSQKLFDAMDLQRASQAYIWSTPE
jgi:hypothetical protein